MHTLCFCKSVVFSTYLILVWQLTTWLLSNWPLIPNGRFKRNWIWSHDEIWKVSHVCGLFKNVRERNGYRLDPPVIFILSNIHFSIIDYLKFINESESFMDKNRWILSTILQYCFCTIKLISFLFFAVLLLKKTLWTSCNFWTCFKMRCNIINKKCFRNESKISKLWVFFFSPFFREVKLIDRSSQTL